MNDKDKLLESLSLDLSDGKDPDWDLLYASAKEERDRQLIGNLRSLSLMASYYREQRDADEMPLPAPGQSWCHLEIVEAIGQGSYARVYRALDTRLKREVALKLILLPPPFPAADENGSQNSPLPLEGERLARVKHPNLVTIYGAEQRGRLLGLWMEFIHGETLHRRVREQGPLGAREASLLGLDLCGALAALHSAGLLHRDVKAQNVMREKGGRIVLMDLGAGAELHAGVSAAAVSSVSGTPLYMAPEVLAGMHPDTGGLNEEPAERQAGESSREGAREYAADHGVQNADPRSDLYSLGVTLYYSVTGRYPVEADDLPALRRMHACGERTPLRDLRPDLPGEFVALVEKAIAPKPSDRFASAGEMEQALAHTAGLREIAAPSVATLRPSDDASQARLAARRAPHPAPRTARFHWAWIGAASLVVLLLGWAIVRFAPGGTYTVAAALYREAGGTHEQLFSGARVSPGDRLYLEFEANRAMHLYILTQDDHGEAYLLFPIPGGAVSNPLPAQTRHRLPPSSDGRRFHWGVSSAGGTERILMVASPAVLRDFEATLTTLPAPRFAQSAPAMALNAEALRQLRGIGVVVEAPPVTAAAPHTAATAATAFAAARTLAAGHEKGRGVWVRQLDLVNPGQ